MTVENEQLMGRLIVIEKTLREIHKLLREVHGMTLEEQEAPIAYATAAQKQLINALREKLDVPPMPVYWFDDLRAIDAVREIERLNSYLDEKIEA